MPSLDTVYLEGNPAQRSEGPSYRRKVQLALPQIAQLDATYVSLSLALKLSEQSNMQVGSSIGFGIKIAL